MSLRGAGAPALHTLRAYWGTTVLLAAACAAALAVLVPAFALVAPAGAGQPPHLTLPAAPGGDLGLVWSTLHQDPEALRRAAVTGLSRLLLGVALGVLAVTWLSALSLATARASARAPEIVIRRAVGASRLHLLVAALLEGALIAAAALVVGGAVGVAGARLALGAWPGTAVPATLPAVVAAGAVVAGIVGGALLPLRATRRRAHLGVAEETPLVLAVPALQLGLSLTVLVAASLLTRRAAPDARTATARGGEVFAISLSEVDPARRAAAYGALLRALRARPWVRVASLASPGTLVGLGPVDITVTDCGACMWGGLPLPWHSFLAAHYLASADTFRALRLPIVTGRGFTDADAWGAAPVAVISRSLAERHFEAAGAVGRGILVGRGSDSLYTVVGVVEDRQSRALGGGLEPAEAVYLSVLQHPAPAVELLVRGPGDSVRAAGRLVRGGLGLPGAKIERRGEAAVLAAEAAPLGWFAAMFGVEGWAMLAIAVAGTFVVMWLWVASLAGELGLRRALGARRRDVVAHVLVGAALVAAGGLAVGLWVGMMVWDALRAAVSGLPPWDPGAVLRYGALLGAAACAGALLPAWRASRQAPARLVSARS